MTTFTDAAATTTCNAGTTNEDESSTNKTAIARMTTGTPANQDTASVYQDLIQFLQSSRQDLRLAATEAVLQVVHDRYQVLELLRNDVLVPLLRIVSDNSAPNLESAVNALRAILYMTSSVEQVTNQCVHLLLETKAVGRLMELVLSTNPPTAAISADTGSELYKRNKSSSNSNATLINLALAILANLTRHEEGAVDLVGKTLPDYAVHKDTAANIVKHERPMLLLLLDRYMNREWISAPSTPYDQLELHEWETSSHDPYQHFAAILMNITQLESGRKFVLRIGGEQSQSHPGAPQASKREAAPARSVLETLLPQLVHSPNPIRRRGISGMIRNCCLEKEAAWWMLNVVRILTPLLMPLAGPEELDLDEKQGMDPDLWLRGPDKVREIDSVTRQHCVEALLLLCASGKQTRNTLRLARTYVVLKYADMVEESETISDRINECVQYLRRDEEGTTEGSSDRLVEEEYAVSTTSRLQLLPSSQITGGNRADYDDVD